MTDKGIFKTNDGFYGFRFTVTLYGKKLSGRKTLDESGQPFTSKTAAAKARLKAIEKAKKDIIYGKPETLPHKTYKEVYNEYAKYGRSARAYTTKLKQDSLWKNHLQKEFGNKYIDTVSVGRINDYLADLYYQKGYAYKYVESFLKMFYLILGQAFSRNYLNIDLYTKMCLNKATRICMPKEKTSEDDDIVSFDKEQLAILDDYFKGTNAETAYLLGRYCGLRINECYGLKWDNIDLKKGTIRIDRQMQYQNGVITLVPVKTLNGNRTIYMNDKLKVYLQKLKSETKVYEKEKAAVREQKQTMLKDIDGYNISSLLLVNSLPDGKIQTVNSMKFHSRTIKEKLGINFKFHYLRHTYGTLMAEMNTPTHLLCNQMGHGNIHVTQKYYIAISKTGLEILKGNLDRL